MRRMMVADCCVAINMFTWLSPTGVAISLSSLTTYIWQEPDNQNVTRTEDLVTM